MTHHQDRIVVFVPAHRDAWKRLNTDWLIEGGFALEAKDHLTLDDPEGQILSRAVISSSPSATGFRSAAAA